MAAMVKPILMQNSVATLFFYAIKKKKKKKQNEVN